MKNLLLIVILLLSPLCYAEDIKCYSGNKEIYHRHGHNVIFGSDEFAGQSFIMFRENKSKQLVYITANCIIAEKKV